MTSFSSIRSPANSSPPLPTRPRAFARGSAARTQATDPIAWFARWIDHHAILILLAAYGATLAASLALSSQLFWPSIFPDEAQYAMVGENLVRHGVFVYRGDFPLLIPPFYSLIVALSRLLDFGTVSIVPIFLLNHILMIGVMFPAYGLARLLNLSKPVAILVALGAAWVPNMWFVNHYMAEVVYYPLFCLACYLGGRFLLRPDPWSAVLAGGSMGLALLTKNTALALLLALGVASAWGIGSAAVRGEFTSDRHQFVAAAQRTVLWPGLALATAGALYVPWLLLRQRALGGCAQCGGEAGNFSHINLDPGVLTHLLSIYGADTLLSVSALTLLPIVVAGAVLMAGAPRHQGLAVFWLSLILIVIAMAAIYSGELFVSGALVDRHLFVLTPLVLVLTARGITELRVVPRVWVVLASVLSGAALIACLYQYDFRINPLYDTTWTYGLGITVGSLFAGSNWTPQGFFIALGLCAAVSQGIWLIGHRQRVQLFLLAVVLINAISMTAVFGLFSVQGPGRLNVYVGNGALAQWVMTRIAPEQPLLVLGARGVAQPKVPSLAPDLELLGVSEAFGDDEVEPELDALEATGYYDLRMVPQLALLPKMESETHARYLLSPIALTGLQAIGQWGQIELYDLNGTALVGKIPAIIHYSTAPDFYKEVLSALVVPSTIKANGTYTGSVQVQNGSRTDTWRRSGNIIVEVSYHWWYDTGGLVGSYYGVLSPLPHNLAPGQAVTTTFYFQAPSKPGDYLLEVDLTIRQHGSAFTNEGGVPIATSVHVTA